ncbi:MAG: alkaline phosphatase family protein [Proteobacteria bacterium]|nr:alkaline phosphatase family protein [Pseudomonadota bacterium]MBU1738349.1 alkaline phosphatase family protein [Pseudomonadota bacterium]
MNIQITRTHLLAGMIAVTAALAAFLLLTPRSSVQTGGEKKTLKLYWFIPDGLRADPDIFTIFNWAKEGKLPHLRKMMESGTWGYSQPVFPGHTPTNFATLLTGSSPKIHGIADGPMHIEGYPLKMVSKGGFSSIAKKVPPIWYTLEKRGMTATLLSVPGSTPPELDSGITIRGRWGGWGIDFPSIIFQSGGDQGLRKQQGMDTRVFSFGSDLTRFSEATEPSSWQLQLPPSFSPIREAAFTNWGTTVYTLFYDTTNDNLVNYDHALFSIDKKNLLAEISTGGWSNWLPVNLSWQIQNDYNINTPKRMAWERSLSAIQVNTSFAINLIKSDPENFRVRFLYDTLNQYLVKPSYLAEDMNKELGPMVDFPDNYPPQLIYFPEDKATFLEESRRSLAWHRKAAAYLIRESNSDLIIHDIYTPNQMLTSRWWLGGLDPASRHYKDTPDHERSVLWNEVMEAYKGIDDILGEILAGADEETYVVFSSDHGIAPLNREVLLNNFFAEKGLLNYTIDPATGEYAIDWRNTRAIYLKMDNIYINPDGLAGNYHRTSGPGYEQLRAQVIDMLNNELADENGDTPIAKVVKWENAGDELGLPADRTGDLVIANRPGFGWVEEVTSDKAIFRNSLKAGYKQAIIPEQTSAMLTPFVIMGPGIKKNYQLSETIHHIDQYPTIMRLLNQPVPDFVEGKSINGIMND